MLTRLLVALLAVGSVVAALWGREYLGNRLWEPSYLSGWLAWAVLIGLAASWWWPARSLLHLRKRLRLQVLLAGPLLAAVVLHVGSALPTGWVDGLLAVLFMAFVSSTAVGLLLLSGSDDADRVPRWLGVHTAIAFSAAGLALFHGIYLHAHGLLAFWAGGE